MGFHEIFGEAFELIRGEGDGFSIFANIFVKILPGFDHGLVEFGEFFSGLFVFVDAGQAV